MASRSALPSSRYQQTTFSWMIWKRWMNGKRYTSFSTLSSLCLKARVPRSVDTRLGNTASHLHTHTAIQRTGRKIKPKKLFFIVISRFIKKFSFSRVQSERELKFQPSIFLSWIFEPTQHKTTQFCGVIVTRKKPWSIARRIQPKFISTHFSRWSLLFKSYQLNENRDPLSRHRWISE